MGKLVQNFGCLLIVGSALALVGYLVNILWRVVFPRVDLTLKIILLVGISGFIITIGALIIERLREEKKTHFFQLLKSKDKKGDENEINHD